MLQFSTLKQKALGLSFVFIYFLLGSQLLHAQNLSIKDFAIWGGSAPANKFDKKQGVFLKENSRILGNIGSNHWIDIKEKLLLTGNVYSGNSIDLKEDGKIIGNVFAFRLDTREKGNAISGKEKFQFEGNLTAKGKIDLKTGGGPNATKVLGSVSVPAPSSSNYAGPVPARGINNTLSFPTLPSMPAITKIGRITSNTKITQTGSINPGIFKSLELKGKNTLTFNGPGNYIFEEIKNSGDNILIFDLKNSATGTINIYILNDANFGKILVKMVNGTSPSQIFTEVQGDGKKNGGFAFEVESSGNMPNGFNLWLGNVWAPNNGISVKGTKPSNRPHIIGALWSGDRVDIKENLFLEYSAPSSSNLSYVEPYYPPPTGGKVNTPTNIIGAELTSLASNPVPITTIPENEIFVIDNVAQRVMIEVISKTPNDNTLLGQLIALGMIDIVDNGPHEYIITGNFPINKLQDLNSNARIEYVRPLYPPINNRGQVTTQGDVTMRTDKVRERFGLDGSGVKIGVISDSYNNKSAAQDDVDQGDLPGIKSSGEANENGEPVQVTLDLSKGGSDEGRAMLQIVHDVAPKATLAFRTGFLSAGDFAKGIKELASPNLPGGKCDIIVDDLTYITEPFLRDGIVARTVDEVVANGVTYFTSAGNFGKRSYEAVFNGVSNTSLFPAPAQIHRFGANPQDIYQTVTLKPGTYTIVLQWDDQFHSLGDVGVQTDLDLYLVGPTGSTLFGFNRSNLFKDPFEVCPITVKEETVARIMVVRAAGTNNVRFKYIIFRGDATIQDYQTGNSTIVGHANSKGAISVGAMLYANIPGVTPVWPGVASFSSRGGTFTLENNTFITRNKPDIVAPNGVNTTVNLGGTPFNDGDTYPNFFGTSAAAPHAAAVGALLIQGRKKFNLQTTVTPDEIRQQLISTAGKFPNLPATFNFEGGNGYILADAAVSEIANAVPSIDTLISVTPGGATGNEPFMVKVVGEYLTDNTQIYVAGVPVPTTVSPDKTEATAMVNALNGNDPPFQLFNPAKSPSGEDGGRSDPIYFFDNNRGNVIVKAINKTRKYGQPNPEFEVEITLGGVPIALTDITPEDLKLGAGQISFTTLATQESKVGNYGIFVGRTTPLASDDPLLSQYQFTFISGTLSIQKIPLKITPKNQLITYGEFPEEIDYIYELPEELANDAQLLEEVKTLHRQYIPGNGLVVLNNLLVAGHGVEFSDFENIGVLASYQSLRSSRKVAYENGILKPLTNDLPIEQIGDQRFMVDVDVNSMAQYKLDSSEAAMLPSYRGTMPRGLLNLKTLIRGEAEASVPNGQLRPMVNGQLQAMVNGQLQAMVNGQLRAVVNGQFVDAEDITFLNGQLRALVNGVWINIANGQLRAIVNGEMAEFELSVVNGQLQAVVNGQLMPVVNGQLRAVVNGQLVAVVNGQLRAVVNGQLVPVVNGQLVAVVNGQLRPMVNGQLVAVVNGQLLAMVNSELEIIDELSLVNGQLRAVVNGVIHVVLQNGQLQPIVNGQLQPMVNGQLKAMVNGQVKDLTDVAPIANGQLRAVVNGQLIAVVNGQLRAVVNGQLRPYVNGDAIEVERVIQQTNGQLRAVVNGQLVPIVNGQLRALVNGQLLAMVNGQLMAVVNGEVTFVVFQNGQLQAVVNGVEGGLQPLVNGQLQPVVNGQLQPVVNGQLLAVVNGELQAVERAGIVNGQLQAVVNSNETWVYPNGQLKPLVNGQLQPLVNNFDVSGPNNNARTMVVVDENDILLQGGDLGSMFAVPMITGNTAVYIGQQKIIPAAFINENFEVTYGMGDIQILRAPVVVKAADTSKVYGSENPVLTRTYKGLAFDDSEFIDFYPPDAVTSATQFSNVGTYPITLEDVYTQGYNYNLIKENGTFTITPAPLLVKADNKTRLENTPNPSLTITYTGLVGDDTEDMICTSLSAPAFVQPGNIFTELERQFTYSNVKINGQTSVYQAQPGESLNLTGSWYQIFVDPSNPYCSGCITQLYIGMGNGSGGNTFTYCTDVSGLGDHSGVINSSFQAPTQAGVYYITQRTSWYYSCYQPGQGAIIHEAPNNVIAVVIVGNGGGGTPQKLSASTTASINSLPGSYPITLTGCSSFNPNYNVVLQNGTLTIEPSCITDSRTWLADGNFNEESGTGNGTPVGNVTFGSGGTPNFSFDGSSYITTGTGGSVSGTGDFDVSAWVKTTGTGPMVIIQQRDDDIDGEYILKIGGAHFQQQFDPINTGKAYFMMYDPVDNPLVIDLFSTTKVNDGNWHFIKGMRRGTTISLQVDGTVEATANTPRVVNLRNAIRTFIGYDYKDNGSYFNGLIDEVRVSICNPNLFVSSASASPGYAVEARASIQIQPTPTENKIFPNPATHTLRLQLTEDVVNLNGIQVINSMGQLNKTNTRKIDTGMYETNVSGLPKGVYFLKAQTVSGIKTFKFVKL